MIEQSGATQPLRVQCSQAGKWWKICQERNRHLGDTLVSAVIAEAVEVGHGQQFTKANTSDVLKIAIPDESPY